MTNVLYLLHKHKWIFRGLSWFIVVKLFFFLTRLVATPGTKPLPQRHTTTSWNTLEWFVARIAWKWKKMKRKLVKLWNFEFQQNLAEVVTWCTEKLFTALCQLGFSMNENGGQSVFLLSWKIENAHWAEKTTTTRCGIRETATTRNFALWLFLNNRDAG